MENLTSQTLQDIISYIRENKLQAGDSLPTEQHFLETLSCSRTTLREVLAYLKGLGVVTSRRGSSFKIAHVNIADIIQEIIPLAFKTGGSLEELLELRRCLELGNIESAVINATQEDITTLQKAFDDYDDFFKNNEELNYRQIGLLEASFHSAMLAPARCTFLEVINTSVREYFDSLLHNPPKEALTHKSMKKAHDQHHALLASFKVKNPAAAQACLRQHFASVELDYYDF